MLALGVVEAPGQDNAESKKPVARTQAGPTEAPAAGLLDNGNVFNGEDRGLIEAAVKAFGETAGMPLFIVTENYLVGETVDEYGERLASAWLKGKPGVVMIYERASGRLNYNASPGSLGKDGDPRTLFMNGSKAAAGMPDETSAAGRMVAAVKAMTLAGEVWKKTGKVPPPPQDAPPPPPPAPAPKTDKSGAPPVDFVIDDAEIF